MWRKLLADRQYTVFAGHIHVYQKFIRQGRSYYQLATTGGGSKMRGVPYGEFDHFVWVTMKKEGPVFANVLLDGILPENLSPPISDEEGVPTKNRKEVFSARGKVLLQGKPVAQARVLLFNAGRSQEEAGPGRRCHDRSGRHLHVFHLQGL